MGSPEEEYRNLCKKVIYLVSKEKERYDNFELMAIAYKLLGDEEKMEKYFKLYIKELDKFIQLYPNAYPFVLQRAHSYENLGKKEAAIADYQRVLELNPEYMKVKDKLNKLLNTKRNPN